MKIFKLLNVVMTAPNQSVHLTGQSRPNVKLTPTFRNTGADVKKSAATVLPSKASHSNAISPRVLNCKATLSSTPKQASRDSTAVDSNLEENIQKIEGGGSVPVQSAKKVCGLSRRAQSPSSPATLKTTSPRFPRVGSSISAPCGKGALDSEQQSLKWNKDDAMSLPHEAMKHVFVKSAHLLLNKTRYTSVASAVDALNSGALVVDPGYCIVFSETKKWYFLVRRNDKMHLSLSDMLDLSTNLKPQSRYVDQPQTADASWSVVCSIAIANEWQELESLLSAAANVLFLSRSRWDSVAATVKALNAGTLTAPGGFCVVFARASKSYYLIWRSDMESEREGIVSQSQKIKTAEDSRPKRSLAASASCPSLSKSPSTASVSDNTVERKIASVSSPGLSQSISPNTTRSVISPIKPRMSEASAKARSSESRSLKVSELFFFDKLDLTHSKTKAQLLATLGLSPQTVVKQLEQVGGLNCGVWCAHDPSKVGATDLVLKLVKADRDESKRFEKLSSELPSLMEDSMLAFPLSIIHCVKEGGSKEFDLVVMPRIRGSNLGDSIGKLWWSRRSAKVLKLIEAAGSCLAEFHRRYDDYQHGDFQPSNIHWDEANDTLHFIDLANTGKGFPYITADGTHVPGNGNDVAQFVDALRMLSGGYGTEFLADATRNFHAGYAKISDESD